jgi:hypothetical protein
MQYKLEIDETKITNDNIHISNVSASTGSVMLVSDGVYTGTIPLEEVVANTKTVLTVTIEWVNTDTDTTNNNDTNTGSTSENIQIPIKLTASQLVE